MMRRLLAAAPILMVLALLLQAQDRSKPSDAEGRILALETAWNHAEQAKDAAALDQLLANSLVYIDYDGSIMTKGEFLAEITAVDLHPSQIINDEMTAHVYGDAAIVTGTYREKGVLKGKPYLRHGRFTDTWVKLDGTWQCVASQSTLISK
jgi:ketosteroid isomerase-like protein